MLMSRPDAAYRVGLRSRGKSNRVTRHNPRSGRLWPTDAARLEGGGVE
jgi:hypothetical protein